jgi:hypothetical protein
VKEEKKLFKFDFNIPIAFISFLSLVDDQYQFIFCIKDLTLFTNNLTKIVYFEHYSLKFIKINQKYI